jgi:hypothetical protein
LISRCGWFRDYSTHRTPKDILPYLFALFDLSLMFIGMSRLQAIYDLWKTSRETLGDNSGRLTGNPRAEEGLSHAWKIQLTRHETL